MFKKLLPKEEKYFEDFKEMISHIEEMAGHTEKIFQFDDIQTHIFALIKRLDDVSDMLLGATIRVETFNLINKIDYADKLAAIIHGQVKELGVAIQDLKVKRINEMKTVKTLETEADRIYQQAIKELFEKEKDAIELIKKKEIIDLLERTSDRCQSTANVILSIFIKNA